MRRFAATVGIATIAILTGGLGASAGTSKAPATWISIGSETDKATLTSLCGRDGDLGFCEMRDKNPDGGLPAVPGSKVLVRLRPRPESVTGFLLDLKPDGSIENWVNHSRSRGVKVAGSHSRRWRFHLPEDLKDGNAVLVMVHYKPAVEYPGGVHVDRASYVSRLAE